MKKVGKVIVSLFSVLIVVGVVAAVVVAVVHKHGHKSAPAPNKSSIALDSACANTEYKAACVDTLSPVAQNHSADFKDYIKAALEATIAQVSKSFNLSESLLVEVSKSESQNPRLKMSLEDCNELLNLAVSNLQTTFSHVGNSDINGIHDRSDELKSWLSSVISYAETCVDGVEEPKFQSQLKDTLNNASDLTDNALALISGISKVLDTLGLKLNPKSLTGARRLLAVDESGAFPSWFSAADRKLMAADSGGVTPNAVVAQDGSGQFRTIAAALAAQPRTGGRYVIYVKAGTYNEYITIARHQTNIFMFGDGPTETIVTGSKSFASGFPTFRTASFSVIGQGFICRGMGFRNTAGPQGHQAVALRVQSEMSAFFNCRIDGYQDTLYVQAGRQFYRNCVISGTIDFIFGDATAVIQNSQIIVRRPMDNQITAVTAQGRARANEPTGIVIHNCQIIAEDKLQPVRFAIKSYLGRPWKEYSRTVIMESTLGDFIQPAGWFPWAGNFALNTLYYAEYNNRGPGAAMGQRVKWPGYHIIGRNEALKFTAGAFIDANRWLPGTGLPFTSSLFA